MSDRPTFYQTLGTLKELYREQIELEKKIQACHNDLKQILNFYNNDNQSSIYNEEQGRIRKKLDQEG